MIVRWHGHACFELVPREGPVIVLDPHDGYSIGIKPPSAQADIVLISHDHFDHNAYAVVAKPGADVLKMFVGEKVVRGVRVRGIETFHDKVGGRRRGRNVVYVVEVEGLRVAHLGDLGHVLEPSHVEKMGSVDILLVPVGGTFTIGPEEAWEVIEAVKPRVAIPMHYWVKGMNLPLRPVEDFVSKAREGWEVVRVGRSEVEVSRESLPERKVFVLEPP